MKPMKLLQPNYFDAFHCIGAACEDTCCIGWLVNVDKTTYDRYQTCSGSELASSLHTLITINEKSANDDDYARVVLNGAMCPFLSEGLCSIQRQLGEEFLPNMCATYPRIRNSAGDVLQQSLDLSCPEAARLALLDARPIEFAEKEYTDGSIRPGNFPALDTSGMREFREIQRLVIGLLQNRSHVLWKRLLLLGWLCEELDAGSTMDAIRAHLDSFDEGALAERPVQPAAQVEVVLELIVARITADTTPRRFIECYQEFMSGIQWTPQSTMDEIGDRYAEAYAQHYVSFMNRHEHMIEHYLVNYAYRTLFPFGLPESNLRLRNDRVPSSIAAQYMLLIACYAITRTLLIGMSGFHKSALSADHVIKLVQSCTKTFEHSITYPGRVIELLADKAMTTPSSVGVLVRPPGPLSAGLQ
jgi:lysine-N-methylase